MASPRSSGRTTQPSKRKAEQDQIEAEVNEKKRRTSSPKTSPKDEVASSDTDAASSVNSDSPVTVDDRSSTEPASSNTESEGESPPCESFISSLTCDHESSLGFPGDFHLRHGFEFAQGQAQNGKVSANLAGLKYDSADANLRLDYTANRGKECSRMRQMRNDWCRFQEKKVEDAFEGAAVDMEHANQALAVGRLASMKCGEEPPFRGEQEEDDDEAKQYKQDLIEDNDRCRRESWRERKEVGSPEDWVLWIEAKKEARKQAVRNLRCDNPAETATQKEMHNVMAKHDFFENIVSPEKLYMRTYQRVAEKHEIEDDLKNILSETAFAKIKDKLKKTDRKFRKQELEPYTDDRDQDSYWHDKKWGVVAENKAYLRRLESLCLR